MVYVFNFTVINLFKLFSYSMWVLLRLCMLSHLGHVWLFESLWTVACHVPLSMGFFRQEYWSGFPWPSPGDLPNPGIEPAFPVAPALQVDSLLLSHQGTAECYYTELINYIGEYGREKLGRVLNYLNSSRIPFVWQLQRIIDTWQKVYKRIWGNGIMKLTREWTTSILKICWELIQFTG